MIEDNKTYVVFFGFILEDGLGLRISSVFFDAPYTDAILKKIPFKYKPKLFWSVTTIPVRSITAGEPSDRETETVANLGTLTICSHYSTISYVVNRRQNIRLA